MGRVVIQSQPRQKVLKTPGAVVQVVERLPSKCKALSSNSTTTKTKFKN
jgi:hypothetical protein